ncbi:MAG: YkgJ family cysteine cluster protein [Candidatus Hodarchaeota archaeon]
MKSLRFACTRCGNCCTDKNTIVNVTYLDILRIKNGLNLNLSEILEILGFYVFDKRVTNDDKKKMIISPIMTEKGLAFVGLLKNSLGGCYFYESGKKKCLIYDLRPMFCRTFPFSFGLLDEKENKTYSEIDVFYTEKGKQYCPGITGEAPLIDLEYWIKLGREALEDLKKDYKMIAEWNKAVKNGSKIPNVKNYLQTIFKLNKF